MMILSIWNNYQIQNVYIHQVRGRLKFINKLEQYNTESLDGHLEWWH